MVPPYLAAQGGSTPTVHSLQPLTALRATGLPAGPAHTPGQQRLLDLLAGGALSLSETAAYLDLPVSACRLLAAQLIDDGCLRAEVPLPGALAPDRAAEEPSAGILKEVLHGLLSLR
jgi:hypothetical protein